MSKHGKEALRRRASFTMKTTAEQKRRNAEWLKLYLPERDKMIAAYHARDKSKDIPIPDDWPDVRGE